MENENASQNSYDYGTLVQLPRMVDGEQKLVAFFEKDGVLTPCDDEGKPAATETVAVVKVESEATAGMSPSELRKHISAKMGAPADTTTSGPAKEELKFSADVLDARRKLANTYKYRALMPEADGTTNDGLYVLLGELVFGMYARGSKTTSVGFTHKLVSLPFLGAHESASLAKALNEMCDTTWKDIEHALTTVELRGVKMLFSLLRDGVQDFGAILQNTTAAGLVYKELTSKSGLLSNPMSKSWPLNVYSLYKEILTEVSGDTQDSLVIEINDIASGFATYLTQVTRCISEVGFIGTEDKSYSYDPTAFFKGVNALKAATANSRATSTKTNVETDLQAKSIKQLAETHKQLLLDILLNDTWLSIPFERSEFGTLELSKIVRTFLAMQTSTAKLPSAHDAEEIVARTTYTARLAAMHDRVSRLIHRYSGSLADYSATQTERSDIFNAVLDALKSGNSVSSKDAVKQEEVGKKIRGACEKIQEVVDGIADANIAPANIRSLKGQAVMAVMSYYVDFYKVVRAFLVTKDDVPQLTETEALGYISWLKGLVSFNKTPKGASGLFIEHTNDGQFDDDVISIPNGLEIDDEDEEGREDDGDDEILNDAWIDELNDDALEEKELNPAFRLYLWDWISSFDSEGEALEYFRDANVEPQYELRVDKMAKQFNCTYELALEAFARSRFQKEPELQQFYTNNIDAFDTILDAVEAFDAQERRKADSPALQAITQVLRDSGATPGAATKKEEEDVDVVPTESHGVGLTAEQVAIIVNHHIGAPMYYAVGWSAYWEEYESNLKKVYGKKKARKTRRTEEDVTGAAQYRKTYHRDPPNLFFRSYTKKNTTTYKPAVVVPPVEPKPEEYKHYYFAYGSNLDEDQVQKRTPFAKFVCRVALKDYKLTFVTYNYSWKGGVANVEPSEGDVVYGVLWHFTDEMVTKMDRYEGHPNKYLRKEVVVTKLGTDTSDMPVEIPAIVYEIKSLIDKDDFQPAGVTYYEQIKKAYEKFSLPMIVLEEAQKFATDNKVTYKGWSGAAAGSYYNGFESDDDYYDRWSYRGNYKNFDFENKVTTTPTTTTATAGTNSSVRPTSLLDKNSLFHPDRWYLDMDKEWWSPANV